MRETISQRKARIAAEAEASAKAFPGEQDEVILSPEPQEEAFLDAEEAPVKVSKPKKSEKPVEKTIRPSHKALVEEAAVILSTGCALVALATKHDFWALDAVESRQLAEALAETIPTLPAKQADALAKRMPALRLLLVGGTILGGRVVMEMQARKSQSNPQAQPRQQPAPQFASQEPASPAQTNGKQLVFDIPGMAR